MDDTRFLRHCRLPSADWPLPLPPHPPVRGRTGPALRRGHSPSGFTLIELLVCISIISILTSLLMPALSRARAGARSIQCSSNLRQLGQAWQLYADSNGGYCMPQVWFNCNPYIYWWGAYTNPPDYARGILYPYLDALAGQDNVFDCPEQPWGSYIPQGVSSHPTTTYGYNGLYLAPVTLDAAGNPVWVGGWPMGSVPNTRWHTVDEIESAARVFVFADSLIEWFGRPKNCCLLDGPLVPRSGGWQQTQYRTLCFRPSGRACIVFADGHADGVHSTQSHVTWRAGAIGYAGETNAPHYVPDYRKWW